MRILGAVLLASLVLFAPAVAAAERGGTEHHQQRKLAKHKQYTQDRQQKKLARRLRRFDRLVERFDRNGDGVVSADEAPRKLEKLRRFDRNGDGWLDRDELMIRRRR